MPEAPLVGEYLAGMSRRLQANHQPGLPPWAALLEHFYRPTGLPLPRVELIPGGEMPQPYRALLVHNSDMTPALEAFHGQTVGLTVLSREHQEGHYLREVILDIEDRTRPVEYGVIRICLDHFPAPSRRRILEEQYPLGNILHREGVAHFSWPQNFFRLQCDSHIKAMLRLNTPAVLYGRRNVLLDGARRLLAEVIEVLPPARTNSAISA